MVPAEAESGLSWEEVHRLQAIYGPNEIGDNQARVRFPLLRSFCAQLANPLIAMLLLSALVSLLMGQLENALSIAMV